MTAPLRIGLTGGIGSGKSVVATHLARLGATVIDTDAIAHRLTGPGGAAMPAIEAEFGAAVVAAGGALDRSRMRELVFSDDGARRRLEAILHPLIAVEAEREAAASGAAVLVFDVPLLVESGRWRERVDVILVVDCSPATQVERVVARSGWRPEMVEAVIARQATREARLAAADAVIVNDGISLARLEAEVASLWQRWTG